MVTEGKQTTAGEGDARATVRSGMASGHQILFLSLGLTWLSLGTVATGRGQGEHPEASTTISGVCPDCPHQVRDVEG